MQLYSMDRKDKENNMGFMDIMTWPFGEGQPLGSKKADIITKDLPDPRKEAVASPMSKFLASEVGQGVPRYGERITGEFPEEGMNRASEFLALDPSTFFEEKIQAPAIETFKEDLFPLVREEFAGSLSGSGRFRTEEEAVSRFTRGLAETRAGFEMELPQRQFEMAQQIKQERDKEATAQYGDWLKSLPQANPVLDKAMSFLQSGTSTGKTVLSYLDAGREGILGDLLQAAAQVAGMVAMAA